MKRLFVFFLCLMFIMCLVGCNENKLENLKNSEKKEINNYVQSLNENNYTEEDWKHIIEIANNSYISIDKEENINIINNHKKNALAEIDLVIPSIITNEWIVRHYDLNDEKKIWKGNIDEEFTDDLIIVTLKKTYTYPILDLNCFGLENATKIEYVGGVTPPEYFFKPEFKELLEKYRQIIFIHLEPLGKEKVIESIRKLEELEFIKRVNPNYIEYGT